MLLIFLDVLEKFNFFVDDMDNFGSNMVLSEDTQEVLKGVFLISRLFFLINEDETLFQFLPSSLFMSIFGFILLEYLDDTFGEIEILAQP